MDTEDQSDLNLIKAAKEDIESFVFIYDRYIKSVYGYFMTRVRHKETAEDLTAQTFFQALRAFDKYTPQMEIFAPWLFKIAHNILVTHFRRDRQTDPLEYAGEVASNMESSEQIADRNFDLRRAEELLSGVTDRDREIVTLRLVSELSFTEIGNCLGMRENAARTAYHRAVKKIDNLRQQAN